MRTFFSAARFRDRAADRSTEAAIAVRGVLPDHPSTRRCLGLFVGGELRGTSNGGSLAEPRQQKTHLSVGSPTAIDRGRSHQPCGG
jgi:hypothetical protein